MDQKTREILDKISERPLLSKLEPHRELISGLRRKRRTYAEIADILMEQFKLHVAASTIHHFVRVRSQARGPRFELKPATEVRAPDPSPPASDAWARIEAFKNRPRPDPPSPRKRFEFDENKPLTLKPRTTEEKE